MIRFKKGMAVLLSLAMIATSFQIPIFAEEITGENISVETTAETTAETETEITEETEVELGENLDTVYVYNAKDLVSALNGKGSYEWDPERIKQGSYKIKISQYDNSTNSDQWVLSGNDVKNIQLNKEISEIDFSNQEITFDSSIKQSETDYFKLVIPKEAEITLMNTSNNFPWMIENQGHLVLDSDVLCARYASAVSNNGFLEIKGSTISGNGTTPKGKNVITNTGNMIVYNGKIYNDGDSDNKENAAIYSLGGSVSINGGSIYNKTASGNAIYLSGSNTVATVRGVTSIYSEKGSAVVNRDGAKFIMNEAVEDGKYIQIFNNISTYPTVYTYNEAITEMYSGNIYNKKHGQVVRTTPMSVNSRQKDGKLIMNNGNIGVFYKASYGIVYNQNKPVLKNGVVGGDEAAVMKVSDNGTPDKITTYQFENRDGKIVNAYEKSGNDYVALKYIMDGLYGLNGSSNDKYIDSVEVNTYEELKAAIDSTSVNHVKMGADITISGNLVFDKDFTILFMKHTLKAPNMEDTISINEGKKVNFVNRFINYDDNYAKIQFNSISSNCAALLNRGEFYLEDVNINGIGTKDGYTLVQNEKPGRIVQCNANVTAKSSSVSNDRLTYALKNYGKVLTQENTNHETIGNNTVSVYNEGEYRQESNRANCYADGSHSTAVWNEAGTFDIVNGSVYQKSTASSNTAIYINGGKVILQGGTVKTNSHSSSSHAIVYTKDHMPTLIGGTVTGAAGNAPYSLSKNEPARGSAVVCLKDGKITTGSYSNENGETVNSKNAIYIRDGKIQTNADAHSETPYFLMEKGEFITDMLEAMKTNGEIQQNYLTFAEYTLSSNNPTVVSVSDNKMVIAEGVGYARLTFQWKDSGVTDSVRIEVIEKNGRATISANDYSASLINKVEYVNAYQTEHEVAMEWHLTSSEETSTGGECKLIDAMNIHPQNVIIEDDTFNKYFNCSWITYDTQDKKYCFTIEPKFNSDASVKLIEDQVSNIDNIEVKIQVTNGAGVTSVKTIGRFTIVLQNKKPTMTFKQITLNSAFQSKNDNLLSYKYYQKEQIINAGNVRDYLLKASGKITSMKCDSSEGILIKDDMDPNDDSCTFSYSGDGSVKKGKIHVKAKIDNYNGTYETDIPVKIVKSYPVVTLAEKSIAIAEDVEEMTDIKVTFHAKNTFSLGTMTKVEITDKNSKFEVSTLLDSAKVKDFAKKGVYQGPYVYLQPKQSITKVQTVNLKVTYSGTAAVKGKEYSTKLKVTMKPIKRNNFSMNLKTKNPMLLTKVSVNNIGYQQYGETIIDFTTSPTNYKGGYFTVSNLNGTEVKGVSINKVTTSLRGNYRFTIFANKDIVNNKTGKLDLYVTHYGNDGKELGKKMKVTIKLIKESSLTFTKKEVTMNVNSTWSKMVTKVPIKIAGIENWYITECDSSMFKVYSYNAKNIWIQPLETALYSGQIVPGDSYQLKLKGTNEIGEVVNQDITVEVIKAKIKNNICDLDTLLPKKSFTLYKSAPTTQQTFTVITQNPVYGMFVKNVEVTDQKSLFELDHAYQKSTMSYTEYVNDFGYSYEDYQSLVNGQFRLCFKNGKVNNTVSKKTYPVKIRITYENGQTVDKKIKVNVK